MASPAERMHALFAGAETHHGTYDPQHANKSEKGKVEISGTARTVKTGGATPELWRQHLDGVRPLGVVPIREDGTCLWGAIDVDDYPVDHATLAAMIERQGLPLVVCRTKSGGAHLYLFVGGAVAAATLRTELRTIAGRLGHKCAEVFPKQDRIDPAAGTYGNWLNMPYFGDDETDRYGVKPTGMQMSLQEFLRIAESLCIAPDDLVKLATPAEEVPTRTSEPACLGDARTRVALYVQHIDGAAPKNVNNILTKAAFDLARYCRDANLPEDEARSAIERVWQARKMDDPDGQEFGDVWRRQFDQGIVKGRPAEVWGGGLPVFERVEIERDGVESTWTIQLEGLTVRMSSDDVLDQRKFNNRCLAQIDRAYPIAKHRNQWIALVTAAAASAEHVKPVAGTSAAEEFRDYLEDFLTNRNRGENRDEILLEKPFHDQEAGRHLLRLRALRKYLRLTESRFASESLRGLGRRIRELGGGDVNLTIKGKPLSVHWVPDAPFSAIPDDLEKRKLPSEPV